MAAWEQSLQELVRTRGTALVGYAYLLCGDRREAEDLVQDALVKTYARSRVVGGHQVEHRPPALAPTEAVKERAADGPAHVALHVVRVGADAAAGVGLDQRVLHQVLGLAAVTAEQVRVADERRAAGADQLLEGLLPGGHRFILLAGEGASQVNGCVPSPTEHDDRWPGNVGVQVRTAASGRFPGSCVRHRLRCLRHRGPRAGGGDAVSAPTHRRTDALARCLEPR